MGINITPCHIVAHAGIFLIIQRGEKEMNIKEISDILWGRRMLLDDFVVIRKQKYIGLYRIERDPVEELYIIGEPVRYDNDFPHGELLFSIDGRQLPRLSVFSPLRIS